MKFDCPECSQRLQCGDELAGSVVKCPHCQTRLTIPDADETTAESPPPSSAPPATTQNRDPSSKTSAASRGSPRPTYRQQRRKWTDSTNVSSLGSGLIGLGFAIVFYILLLPFHHLYFGKLFMARGWVPYVLIFMLGWSLGFLFLKMRKLATQKNALLLDLLPSTIASEIDAETVDVFLDHVNKMPPRLRDSFMATRIRKGLEHFSVRHSNPEVAGLLMSQSEIDAGAVHSSYSVVKVFIWAIPILGFIGTVLGISSAVGGFSGALDQAQDIEVLKASLNDVTSGLAVAFDTTLVALVMSLIVSFPVSIMQKREEDFLGQVDEYCSENLVKRLNDAGGVADVASHTNLMMQALSNAMSRNQGDLLEALNDTQAHLLQAQQEQADYFQSVNAALDSQTAQHMEEAEARLSHLTETVQHAVDQMTDSVKSLVTQQIKDATETSQQHQQSVEALIKRLAEPMDQSVTTHVNNLTEGLSRLNDVLGKLGERQVIIQQPPKRAWFGLGKRKPESSTSRTTA